MSLVDNTWAFAQVLEDVVRTGRQGKSVVVYPRTSLRPSTPAAQFETQSEWNRVKQFMDGLCVEDVAIVSCAGDDAQTPPRGFKNNIDRFPARWSSPLFPIIAAGAVTRIGGYAKFSRGTAVSPTVIWACGDGVKCASNDTSRDWDGRWGTAFAAGMVSSSLTFSTALANVDFNMCSQRVFVERAVKSRCTIHTPYSKEANKTND